MISVEHYPQMSDAARATASGGRYLGGGTLVMRDANHAEPGLDRIIRSTDPALKTIREDGQRVVIGASVTMAMLIKERETEFLAGPARAVGGPAIRSAATVGGNIFAPHPYGDLAAVLLALDGIANLADGGEMPLEQLFASRENFSGLVVSVAVAKPDYGTFWFKKVSRVKPKGVSIMSIAAWLPQSAGRISNARIAFAAMGPTPLRAQSAERALEGGLLDETTISQASNALTSDLQPFDDPIATGWYRREVAAIHLKRLLMERSV